MQLLRSAFNLTSTVVSTAFGLVGRARDMVFGGDDDVWNKDAQVTTTSKPSAATTTQARTTTMTRTAEPAAAKPAPAKPTAKQSKPRTATTRAKAEPRTASTGARANGTKVASGVALKDRPSLAERLETVSGIGPAKRKAILDVYDDVDALAKSDVSTLAEIDGISVRLAKSILSEVR